MVTPSISVASSSNSLLDYAISDKVIYNVDIDFLITHINPEPRSYYLEWTRMSSTDSNIKIPYQEIEDYQSEILGTNLMTDTYVDKFNNTFDMLRANLSYGEAITIKNHYKIKLNNICLNTKNLINR